VPPTRGIRLETDPQETRRALDAIAKAERLTPDVVLMDMRYQHSTS
jgi:chemotaxis response regulator CheB